MTAIATEREKLVAETAAIGMAKIITLSIRNMKNLLTRDRSALDQWKSDPIRCVDMMIDTLERKHVYDQSFDDRVMPAWMKPIISAKLVNPNAAVFAPAMVAEGSVGAFLESSVDIGGRAEFPGTEGVIMFLVTGDGDKKRRFQVHVTELEP